MHKPETPDRFWNRYYNERDYTPSDDIPLQTILRTRYSTGERALTGREKGHRRAAAGNIADVRRQLICLTAELIANYQQAIGLARRFFDALAPRHYPRYTSEKSRFGTNPAEHPAAKVDAGILIKHISRRYSIICCVCGSTFYKYRLCLTLERILSILSSHSRNRKSRLENGDEQPSKVLFILSEAAL